MTALGFDAEALIAAGFPLVGRRFLLWRTFPPRRAGGKPVKSPCSPSGYAVSGNDEWRWMDFERAVALARQTRLGLGVALGWGFAGLDLDDCRNERGELSDLANRILRHFPTYSEVSPSGTGTKTFFFATPAFTTTAKRDDKDIELYAGRRFFALTGRPLGGAVTPIADCTTAALALLSVLRPPRANVYAGPFRAVSGNARARIQSCEVVRERPSIHGGTVYTLRVCPFTSEVHTDGGAYAVTFPDGGALFVCNRSVHGARREMMRESVAGQGAEAN